MSVSCRTFLLVVAFLAAAGCRTALVEPAAAPGVHAVGNDVVTSGKVTFDDLLEVDPYRLKGHGVTLSQLETRSPRRTGTLLVLVHQMEKRWKNRPPGERPVRGEL